MSESFLNGRVVLHAGDSRAVLKTLADNSIDSIVTDPPYALVSIVKRFGGNNAAPVKVPEGGSGAYARASSGFMGKQWDTGETAFAVEFWQQCLRVLKPGGHVVAFSGTRTYHRMACAIEDAGFEIRDQLQWVYGSGFPKSHDVSKGLDKTAGHWRGRAGAITIKEQPAKGTEYERTDKGEPITASALQWQGWGTALKPSCEPICFGRKPLSEKTVAQNVLAHGVGAINIDGCRVAGESTSRVNRAEMGYHGGNLAVEYSTGSEVGRWPANLLHDGSDEVLAGFPSETVNAGSGNYSINAAYDASCYDLSGKRSLNKFGDSGSAARFFASFPSKDDTCHFQKPANSADHLLSLRSEAAVSVLSDAVARSTLGAALNSASYRAPSIVVTESELSRICEAVTGLIQNIASDVWQGSPPKRLSLRLDPAEIVATSKPIGIITITISLSRSNGFADLVTFDAIVTKSELGESASASCRRLHYTAKADADDRLGSKHPTVKPVDLMQWLCRLVTPPGGTILDMFAGTGTTGEAAYREGFNAVLIERELEYQQDIRRRMGLVLSGPDERARESIKARLKDTPVDHGPLFGGLEGMEAAE